MDASSIVKARVRKSIGPLQHKEAILGRMFQEPFIKFVRLPLEVIPQSPRILKMIVKIAILYLRLDYDGSRENPADLILKK